jgi:hypothetical protein
MKHTKTPWEWNSILNDKYSGNSYGIHGDDWIVAEITPIDKETDKANAAFIVKAVNNHNQLLEALQDIIIESEGHNGCSDTMSEVIDEIRRTAFKVIKAIKQAEES